MVDDDEISSLRDRLRIAEGKIGELQRSLTSTERDLRKKDARVKQLEQMINNPEIEDFIRGMRLEAAHQIERWGVAHDAGKTPADWYWLLAHLSGKALHAAEHSDLDKAKHHCISSAAMLLNWHRYLNGANDMRPGIAPPEESS